jgi:Glycosyl hydrolases family 2, TIM barrel domain
VRDLRSATRASARVAISLAFCAVLAQRALVGAVAPVTGHVETGDVVRWPLAARGAAVPSAHEVAVPPAVWPAPSTPIGEAPTAPRAVPTAAATPTAPRAAPTAAAPPVTPTLARPAPTRAAGPTARPAAPSARTGPMRGIGYNPIYAKDDASPEARTARLRRDLRLMADVGVDMVLGWDPGVFDEALLDAAEANGVGVLMPFELRPEYNYAEPETRAQLLEAILAWVGRYRSRPGVRMWAIGNEVTLEMGDAERRAFADFYAELLPRVRAADPSRPVLLREAEDVFAPYLAEALARRGAARTVGGAVAAPAGFVYGVNFYTDRLGSALDRWVDQTGLDVPLLVSEYAPAGVGRAGRAERLARMHAEIAAAGPRVIGSAPYTWTTDGPEAVDAYFGLVDDEGQPVDDTVAALARLYGVEPPDWARVAVPVDERRDDPAELTRLIAAAVQEAVEVGGQDSDAVRAGVLAQTRAAAAQYGVGEQEGSAEGPWAVAQLIGWARALAAVRRDDERLFPGLHEALPLLDGMARWSAVEPSADETARSFLASVLRRDLESAAEASRH